MELIPTCQHKRRRYVIRHFSLISLCISRNIPREFNLSCESRGGTSDFRLTTSDFRLPTSDFRLQNLNHRSSTRRTQNMDRGPLFFKRKSPLLILNENLPEKHRHVFIAYVLEGLSRKSGLLWDRARHKWEDHKLVFIPTVSNCNSIKKTPRPTPLPRLSFSTVHKNKPIYFINEVYPTSANL